MPRMARYAARPLALALDANWLAFTAKTRFANQRNA